MATEPRIAVLNFKRQPGPRWAQMQVGMSLADLLSLSLPRQQVVERVQLGQIEFKPPLTSKAGAIISKGATEARSCAPQWPQRLCLCCGNLFASEGPHNRMCGPCRTRNVSPFEPN